MPYRCGSTLPLDGPDRHGWTFVAGFESFVADLVAFEARQNNADDAALLVGASTVAQTLAPVIARDTALLLSQILDEIATSGILIAVSAGIANAAAKGSLAVRRSSVTIYAPVQTPLFRTLTGSLPRHVADANLCRAVQAYCVRLSLAQRMTWSFAGTDDNVLATSPAGATAARPAVRVTAVDGDVLADAWRRACRATTDCMAALQAALGPLAGDQASPVAFASELLRQAEAGGCPCMEPDGRVTIPGWAERRREPRHTVQLAATAQIGERFIPVMIRDASPSGLGLESSQMAAPGERIVVRLPGDRQLPGDIAWSDGQRIGVRLDRPLMPGDPLLVG